LGRSTIGHPQIEGAFPPDRIVGLVKPLLGGFTPEPMQFADQGPGGIKFRGGRKRFKTAPAIDPRHERAYILITRQFPRIDEPVDEIDRPHLTKERAVKMISFNRS
jgi:hypothetical protein